jgi:3-oxoacyl-[acyl-carrier protein] reductase
MAETGIRDDVQVNAICPGTIRTERFQKRIEGLAVSEEEFIRSEGITRIGEVEDVAGLVAFLVSPAGRFLHGALIDIDGGATKTI